MNQITIPLRGGIRHLSQLPWAFDCLRWILEGGFGPHRDLLARHFPKPLHRILDCGCGTGIYSDFFPSHSYVGIDISANYIARAQTRFPEHRFRKMDATQLEFPDNCFDAAIISGVIHHLDSMTTHRVLSEIRRVLEPSGCLLVWEDVPTRNPLNLVGDFVHRLDVGEFIRRESEYAKLLSEHFQIDATESFRSGFMDYVAFRSRNSLKQGIATAQVNVNATIGREPKTYSDAAFTQ